MTTNSDALPGWFKGKQSRQSDEPDVAPPSGESAPGATTGGDIDQAPVIVWEAANRLEAEIVAGRLQSEEIPAIIRGEALGAIYGLTTGSLAAAVVLVPSALAEKALEILSADVDWDESADPDCDTEPL